MESNDEILAPGIVLFKYGNLPIFKNITSAALSYKDAAPAKTFYQGAAQGRMHEEVRKVNTCRLIDLKNGKSLDSEFNKVISDAIKKNRKYFPNPIAMDAGYEVLKYEVNGIYSWHNDQCTDNNRIATMMAYCNNDFTGGKFEFAHFNISIKPEAGDIVIFCAHYPYAHRCTKVTSGNRIALKSQLLAGAPEA